MFALCNRSRALFPLCGTLRVHVRAKSARPTIFDLPSFNEALERSYKDNKLPAALELWKGMKQQGIEPNASSYSIMIKLYTKEKQTDQVDLLFDEMVENGITPSPDLQKYSNNEIYAPDIIAEKGEPLSLLSQACREKKIGKVFQLFKSIEKEKIPLKIRETIDLISVCEVGDRQEITNFLEYSLRFLTAAHKEEYNQLLKFLIKKQDHHSIVQVITQMNEQEVAVRKSEIASLLSKYASDFNIFKYLKILELAFNHPVVKDGFKQPLRLLLSMYFSKTVNASKLWPMVKVLCDSEVDFSESYTQLIDICATRNQHGAVLDVFDQMSRCSPTARANMTLKMYHDVMRSYINQKKAEEVVLLFEEMKNANLQATTTTHHFLVQSGIQTEEYDLCQENLAKLNPKAAGTLSATLEVYCAFGKDQELKDTLATMKKEEKRKSVNATRALLQYYRTTQNWEESFSLIQDLHAQSVSESTIATPIIGPLIMSVQSYCKAKEIGDNSTLFVDQLRALQLAPNDFFYTQNRITLLKRKDIGNLVRLMDQMKEEGIQTPLFESCNAALKHCANHENFVHISGLFKHLGSKVKKITFTTLLDLFHFCIQSQNISDAKAMNMLLKPRSSALLQSSEILPALILLGAQHDDYVSVFELLDEYKSLGSTPPNSLFESLFIMCGEKKQLPALEELLSVYQNFDGTPGKYTLPILANAYALCGHLEGAFSVLEFYKTFDLSPDPVLFSTLLINSCRLNNIDRCFEVLDLMEEYGVAANDFIYENILTIAGKYEQYDKAMELMEKLLSSHGMEGAKKFLEKMQDMSGANQMKKADLLFSVLGKTEEFTESIVTYNTMIGACGRCGKLSEAFEYFEALKQKGFTPDAYTFNSLLSACLRCGNMEKGLEVLQLMKEEVKIENLPALYFRALSSLAWKKTFNFEQADNLLPRMKEDFEKEGITVDEAAELWQRVLHFLVVQCRAVEDKEREEKYKQQFAVDGIHYVEIEATNDQTTEEQASAAQRTENLQ